MDARTAIAILILSIVDLQACATAEPATSSLIQSNRGLHALDSLVGRKLQVALSHVDLDGAIREKHAQAGPARRLKLLRRRPVLHHRDVPGPGELSWRMRCCLASRRPFHPAALRNRGPILEALQSLVPKDTQGNALEIASGSGCHLEHFAVHYPGIAWQPSEDTSRGIEALEDLDAVGSAVLPNVLRAVGLDASTPWEQWPAELRRLESYDLVYASNLAHISPWRVTCGLLEGAGQALRRGGLLILYGPFTVDGAFTTDSNADFDVSLRARDPEWGYRDVADIEAEAALHGLRLEERRDMPANNFLLVLRKDAETVTEDLP